MAYGYDVKIEIRFNEHDNEEWFIGLLQNIKKQLENTQPLGHQDIFVKIDWGKLKDYFPGELMSMNPKKEATK